MSQKTQKTMKRAKWDFKLLRTVIIKPKKTEQDTLQHLRSHNIKLNGESRFYFIPVIGSPKFKWSQRRVKRAKGINLSPVGLLSGHARLESTPKTECDT